MYSSSEFFVNMGWKFEGVGYDEKDDDDREICVSFIAMACDCLEPIRCRVKENNYIDVK